MDAECDFNMVSVWVAFPSACTEAANAVLSLWHLRGYQSMVLIDNGDSAPNADVVIVSSDPFSFPKAANRLCRECVERGADIVVLAGHDINPEPFFTMLSIGDEFASRCPTFDGVMQPNGDAYGALGDDVQYQACVSPWIGKGFIERMGGAPYFEGYTHYWSDAELLYASHAMGVFWMNPQIVQYHAHPTRGHPDHLPPHKRAALHAAHNEDRALFLKRKAEGFPR